jgi:hypothetical protein
VIFDEEA